MIQSVLGALEVISGCAPDCPKMQWLERVSSHYLLLWVRNWEAAYRAVSSPRSHMRLQSGWQLHEDSCSMKDPFPRRLTYMAGESLLVVSQRPKILRMWVSPQGCLRMLTAWRLAAASERSKRAKVEATMSFLTQPEHYIRSLQPRTSSSESVREKTTRGCAPGASNLGAI